MSQGCIPADSGWLQDGQGLVCEIGALSLAPFHLEAIKLPSLPTDSGDWSADIASDEVHNLGALKDGMNCETSSCRGSWYPCQSCPPGHFSDRPGSIGCWRCTGADIAPLWGVSTYEQAHIFAIRICGVFCLHLCTYQVILHRHKCI